MVGISVVVASFSTWLLTYRYVSAVYETKIAILEREALSQLVLVQDRIIQIERQQVVIATEVESENNKLRKELETVENSLAESVNVAGGLYDPNTSNRDTDPKSSISTSQSSCPPTTTKLSRDLEKLLLSEAKRADEAARYAQICYQWIERIKNELPVQSKKSG